MTKKEYISCKIERVKSEAEWELGCKLEPFSKIQGNFVLSCMLREQFDSIIKSVRSYLI